MNDYWLHEQETSWNWIYKMRRLCKYVKHTQYNCSVSAWICICLLGSRDRSVANLADQAMAGEWPWIRPTRIGAGPGWSFIFARSRRFAVWFPEVVSNELQSMFCTSLSACPSERTKIISFWRDKKTIKGHRTKWEFWVGIAKELQKQHTCNNFDQ